MQGIFIRATFLFALLAAGAGNSGALAVEAGGVRFDDRINLEGHTLVANGAGVRSRFFIDVYAIALYLPAPASTPEALVAGSGPRRITIVPLRDVGAASFVDALRSGLLANLGQADYAALEPQIENFASVLMASREVSKGQPVTLDYLPGTGTRLSINGQQRGKDIPGPAFYAALLKVWLGEKPVQADLKAKLLGG